VRGKLVPVKIHLQVLWRALVFGFGAYAVVRVLVFVTAHAGLLDWLKASP